MPTPSQRGTPQNKGAPLYSTYSRVGARKSRIFAGSAGLELDPSAHARTDPVKALGALLKLLTSLPFRIGGCQYKLTPAEHTLSLHLISIIDPFVCHGARALTIATSDVSSFSSLVDQPTEILDAILSHVDSRKDLLNIGLVCKRLRDVIFPRHFDYRVIRCKLSSIRVWNHLIVHKSLARNVRKLEILDERSSTPPSVTKPSMLIPRISQRDTDLENTDDELRMHSKQEKYLAEALVHMTGLKEFKWSCNHSPISIAHVWPTLMVRASNLRTLEICDNLLFGPRFFASGTGDSTDSSESDHDEAEPTYSHSGLMTHLPSGLLSTTNVVFRSTSHSFGAAKQPDLQRISRMLQKCPKLESLEITYIPPRASGNATGGQTTTSRIRPLADDFFTYSPSWASTLTTLMLNNIRCSTSSAPLTFLSEHPALEVLHLDISLHIGSFSGPNNRLPHGSLPNLREIKSSKEVINAILECPSDAPRPLQTLKGFKLSGQTTNHVVNTSANSSRSVPDAVFLSNLKHQASTVHRVELSGWYDMEDIRKLVPSIPNVHYLALGKRIGAMGRWVSEKNIGGSSGPSANIIEWIDLLSTLPDLSTLHGVRFFYEVVATPADPSRPYDHSVAGGSNNNTKFVSQPAQMSMMERSRMRKNDEVASVLTWKCDKLRWVDHWEEGSGKIIHLVRDHSGSPGEDGKDKWYARTFVRNANTDQRGTPQNKGAPLYSACSRVGARKPRIFAGSAGLELDPSAHARTDPVKALGALLKLLTSLPFRIGGCQYKLTPAEHTLSLHLISIIDPFVCHGARALTIATLDVSSFSSLVDQPTEILDAILSHVDSRKDLLNIGLVCKRLRDVIFPRHFDYRVIRCKLSSIRVWNHLIVHKSLARNVRKLEILDERSSTPSSKPSILIPPTHGADPLAQGKIVNVRNGRHELADVFHVVPPGKFNPVHGAGLVLQV